MGLFSGKKGIIMGVVNDFSLATGIAKFLHAEGAQLGFSHLPDQDGKNRMAQRVQRVADPLGVSFVKPCDVSSDQQISEFFAAVQESFGQIDFLVHSIAFAPLEDIRCPTLEASRQGFHTAMDISVYSFIAVARAAAPLFAQGGAMVTLSYFGGEKVVHGYNMMGVCKAALEMTTRYLALDLGPKNIRVNAVSAGPIKTLASSAVGEFSKMLGLQADNAPLGRNITTLEVGKACAYLLSDLSSATTGEIMHVDGGFNIMSAVGRNG
ncbi:MAG: enoyl-ACP reductase [Proteobacteria bacterium]|nr:enoyl-ACP reductase [Pseudomonadota bacterium]